MKNELRALINTGFSTVLLEARIGLLPRMAVLPTCCTQYNKKREKRENSDP